MNSLFTKLLKKNFSQKVVKIPYNSLIDTKNHQQLYSNIQEAYDKNGLGILIVENVPNVCDLKTKLFNTGHELVNLPEDKLKKLERPESNYAFGWSYGKEFYFDKPDYFKASYYANLVTNTTNTEHPQNVWSEDLPDLKPNFYNLGNLIRNIGFNLLDLLDAYTRTVYPGYKYNYSNLIKESDNNVGRLLYYFPRNKFKGLDNEIWCDWHNDHSSLTGLASASYIDESGKEAEGLKLTKTGLYIQNRKGEVIRTTFGKNDIAYQLGETFQIHSGGLLNATPHAVQVHDDIPENIGRCTFALFLGPKFDVKLETPPGSKIENIVTNEIYQVPKIQKRFKPGQTFGDFHNETLKTFYK